MKLQLAKIILPALMCVPTVLIAESDSIFSEELITSKVITKKPQVKHANIVNDFSFKDLNGKQHNFKDYRGKWVIVNYWATYCPPCRVEVTDLNIFYEEQKKIAVVLGLDVGGDPIPELKKFKQEFELSYIMAPAQQSTLLAFGVIEALPTTFIVSPQGELVHRHIGMITYDDLMDYIQPPKK